MISVIIPAYNAGAWLPATVESVFAQTCPDWEMILVDDGSTDNTGALCDRYAAADSRIRVLHKENGGPSSARNRGIDVAHGEWLTFLDTDDLLHPKFLELLSRSATVNDADVAGCSMVKFDTASYSFGTIGYGDVSRNVLEPRKALETTLYQTGDITSTMCARIYAARLFDDLRFTEGILYEDMDMFYRLIPRCRRIVHVGAGMYAYRQRPGSIIHSFTPKRLDVLRVTERMERRVAEEAPELLPAVRDRRMSANFNMFLIVERARRQGEISDADADDIQRDCYAQIRRLRRASLVNGKVRMRNRIGALVSCFGPGVLRKLWKLL